MYVRYRNHVRITVREGIMLLHFFCVCCRLPTADLTENTRRHSAMYDIVLPTELLKGCLCVEQQLSCLKTFPVPRHDAISCHKYCSIDTNKHILLWSLCSLSTASYGTFWLAICHLVSFTVPYEDSKLLVSWKVNCSLMIWNVMMKNVQYRVTTDTQLWMAVACWECRCLVWLFKLIIQLPVPWAWTVRFLMQNYVFILHNYTHIYICVCVCVCIIRCRN
jgi:hypothetical protein